MLNFVRSLSHVKWTIIFFDADYVSGQSRRTTTDCPNRQHPKIYFAKREMEKYFVEQQSTEALHLKFIRTENK